VTEIEQKHKNEYGIKPTVVYSCPGKVTYSGEHTEYNDGILLSSTIDLFSYVSISKRDDNSLRVFSVNFDERKKSSISNIKFKREDRWANYIKGVVASILQAGYDLTGMDITIYGEIPMGLGLGSSSAICLATACCIKELYGFDLTWLNLIEAARFSESVFMGLYTGLDDAMTMFFGEKNTIFYLDAATLEYQIIPIDQESSNIYILKPGVNNSEIEMDYMEDRESLYDLATTLSKGRNNHSLRNYRFEQIRTMLGVPERIKRKAIYIIDEIKRAKESKPIIESGDLKLFGRYLVRSHEGLRDLFENTCPEVDWLIKRGSETPGVYGGKASGEICCGVVLFIMEKQGLSNFMEHIEEYDKIFGFKAEILAPKICDGMLKLYSELSS